MSATTAQLLQVAAEIVGGRSELAQKLGIGEALLARFMDGTRALPDPLLLRAVDIILADRQSKAPTRSRPLSPGVESVENRPRGNGGAATDGGGGE